MSLGFLLASTPDYLLMTESMVNCLQHFHPAARIKVLVTDKFNPQVLQFSASNPDVEVDDYTPPAFQSSGWHPLVWAKFEVFRLQNVNTAVFLDVDQIMYNPLTEHIQRFRASKKSFGASVDDDTFSYQFLDAGKINLRKDVPQKALNTGVIITRPDQETYEAVLHMAQNNHQNARLPTQAILNLFAAKFDAWEDLGENLMIHPYSPRVLEEPKEYSLIHLWTPRPSFFGTSPLRSGELTYKQACKKFLQTNKVPYPEEIFKRDFLNRLHNKWPTKSHKF